MGHALVLRQKRKNQMPKLQIADCQMENPPWPFNVVDVVPAVGVGPEDAQDQAMARAISLCDPFGWARDDSPANG
jgi:hypothetical protein